MRFVGLTIENTFSETGGNLTTKSKTGTTLANQAISFALQFRNKWNVYAIKLYETLSYRFYALDEVEG